jgi:hypothetical protein
LGVSITGTTPGSVQIGKGGRRGGVGRAQKKGRRCTFIGETKVTKRVDIGYEANGLRKIFSSIL